MSDYRQSGFVSPIPLTKAVKWIMILTVGSWFVLQVLGESLMKIGVSEIFALYPGKVFLEGHIWQLLTYMFLHAVNITHILFNMLMLWFFGAALELRWGTRYFWFYYLVSGVGAALMYSLCMLIYSVISGSQMGLIVPVIGASGAVYALLLAYGVMFANETMYFFFVFPMKAKYFVILMGLIQFASFLTTRFDGGEVAYLAHLGGLAAGGILLLIKRLGKGGQRIGRQPKKQGKLRLIVNNDQKGPKYWN